jgi:hypothetical protein
MFEFLRDLFSPIVSSPSPQPKVSEKWSLKQTDGDPWSRKKYDPVTIIDVKDGWVKYSMGGSFFDDERMEIKTFVKIYEKV